jgi:hypothetical protein
MANIIKIQNHIVKRYERSESKKRKTNTKEVNVYFLIVCEGEKTEPNYFKSFKKNVKSLVYHIETDGQGSNTKDLVKRTIRARDKSSQLYDRVWVVFDKDSFPVANFNDAILLAEKNNIKAGWTNEAFELWYLLHFQNRITAMSREDYKGALESSINVEIVKQSKRNKPKLFTYKKNSEEMYAILEKYGDQNQAIKWAKELEKSHVCANFAIHNPCTRIHILVEELNGDSEELKKDIESRK